MLPQIMADFCTTVEAVNKVIIILSGGWPPLFKHHIFQLVPPFESYFLTRHPSTCKLSKAPPDLINKESSLRRCPSHTRSVRN